MTKRNNLLSIGEMAKYSNTSIKSLRYYEKLNILKPSFVDPDTNYRYYRFEQLHLIEIICICIEFDIPLKELTEFIDQDNTLDFSNFLSYGKKIAENKLRNIEKGLYLINEIEQEIKTTNEHPDKQVIYERVIPKKHYYIIECETSFDEVNFTTEIDKLLSNETTKYFYDYMLDYGFLVIKKKSKMKRYFFMELSIKIKGKNVITLPSKSYYCIKNETCQIENVEEIFSDYLNVGDSFIAIEVNLFNSKYRIGQPINELRLIKI